MSEEQCYQDLRPIDECGKPTTYLSFMILKTTFSEPRCWFSLQGLARLLVAKYTDVDSICKGLEQTGLLEENTSQLCQYRYNLNSDNAEPQNGFERFLVDVELDNLPLHIMLDYSPSFRSPGYLSTVRR
jgi:hypothetical protein